MINKLLLILITVLSVSCGIPKVEGGSSSNSLSDGEYYFSNQRDHAVLLEVTSSGTMYRFTHNNVETAAAERWQYESGTIAYSGDKAIFTANASTATCNPYFDGTWSFIPTSNILILIPDSGAQTLFSFEDDSGFVYGDFTTGVTEECFF